MFIHLFISTGAIEWHGQLFLRILSRYALAEVRSVCYLCSFISVDFYMSRNVRFLLLMLSIFLPSVLSPCIFFTVIVDKCIFSKYFYFHFGCREYPEGRRYPAIPKFVSIILMLTCIIVPTTVLSYGFFDFPNNA